MAICLGEVIDRADVVNGHMVKMYTFLGVIALMLSTTGLFTLVSLNIIRRTKEIGVRKVLGASVVNITRIINTEFFVILLFASLVGSVLSYFAVDLLMARLWKYYQSTTMQTFIVSISIMFVSFRSGRRLQGFYCSFLEPGEYFAR